ncbi:MAG: nicotinate phosphoribosyltransferase [Phycisphaerae bacterium]
MCIPTDLYRPSLMLLTDLYHLTMAYGYWKSGVGDCAAVFHLFFRTQPFGGGYSIACGLHYAIEWLKAFRFQGEDLEYLGTLAGHDGAPLFEPAFLDYLRELRFTCDVDAIPEGTVVFPHEPLIRVRGPIIQGQLLETPLLNMINFQTLVATKAARVCQAARDEAVLEFGLRRAQGFDGGLAASRAAFVGGCAATSNVLAGRLFGIPVRGTHAHSWVMSFDSELEAFQAYADAMPNNCVFLVDTYDTLDGVRRAIEVGRNLRARGRSLLGVRLDSGDFAYLSIEARRLLDEAGFHDTAIVASNELDEHIIASLKNQGATINVWGVGTKLITAYDHPAMGGVYKLGAIRRPGGKWEHKVKLSEQALKVSNPGIQQVRRFLHEHEFLADMIYDEQTWPPLGAAADGVIVDPLDPTRRKRLPADAPFEDLLVPVFRNGEPRFAPPPLDAVRARTQAQLSALHPGIRRFVNPHQYPVGLELSLHDLKEHLILKARGLA